MRTFRFIFMFVVTAVVLFLPMVAFGQANPCPPVDVNMTVAEQAQTWWMVLLDALVQLTAPLVGGILVILIRAGLKRWFAKMEKEGKKLDAEQQEAVFRLVDGLVTGGIAYAEEQARKGLRTGKVQTEGAEKMQTAVDFVMRNLEESNLPTIGQEALERLIESRLSQERVKPDGVVPGDDMTPKSGTPTPAPASSA